MFETPDSKTQLGGGSIQPMNPTGDHTDSNSLYTAHRIASHSKQDAAATLQVSPKPNEPISDADWQHYVRTCTGCAHGTQTYVPA